jgi:hypothetical protein
LLYGIYFFLTYLKNGPLPPRRIRKGETKNTRKEKKMPDLSPKENYLRALRHEETEYVPIGVGGDLARCGGNMPCEKGDPDANVADAFGVHWTRSDAALGAFIPVTKYFVLKDITQWKKTIAIPRMEDYDWKRLAEQDRAAIDPGKRQALGFFSHCGVWERLAALMGFEEAMIALVEEPEACDELFAMITDYKIKLAEAAAQYYNADVFVNFDDLATERNLFMSPETYRKLIKPHHRRLNDAVRNLGMIPVQHTCGYAETCIDDYIETGAEAWNSVQPSNDIAALLDRYGDRFVFEGGFDSTGKPGRPDASLEEIEAEVERCFREYGGRKGFVFLGTLVNSAGNKNAAAQSRIMFETANRIRFTGKK